MAKIEYDNGSVKVTVEAADEFFVIGVLGLAVAALAGIYLVVRDRETLRSLAENGMRVLNG